MYKYTTFEEEAERKKIRGRVLTVLEFDKIKESFVQSSPTEEAELSSAAQDAPAN